MPADNKPDLFNNKLDDDQPLTKKQTEKLAEVGAEVATVTDSQADIKIKIQQFNSILNRVPLARMVRMLQGYKYLPIRYHKRLMQQLFRGHVKEEVMHYGNIFNEITVHIRVHYLHPVTDIWLFVDGLGSSQIMQDKDTKVADFAMYKKANALQTCLPKAKSEAYKNATSQLGAIFGGDLNRNILDTEGNYDAATHTVKPLNQ